MMDGSEWKTLNALGPKMGERGLNDGLRDAPIMGIVTETRVQHRVESN